MTRVFVDSVISVGAEVTLPPAAAHHVSRVLRLRIGSNVTLFNGTGGEYHGVVKSIERRAVIISIRKFASVERESPLNLTLVQGISRGERMDYAIQKAVELGVTSIVPLRANRTQTPLSDDRAASRINHWSGIIQHACEQCGRNRLPVLHPIFTIDELLHAALFDRGVVLEPRGSDRLDQLESNSAGASIGLVIGPEGGLDTDELDTCRTAGFMALGFGPRILRTETAAVVGLSVLQALQGDLLGDANTNDKRAL